MYRTTYREWPAFAVTGISRIVASGGEVYDAVRRDGRWEALRRLGREGATLYGVASFDKAASQGARRFLDDFLTGYTRQHHLMRRPADERYPFESTRVYADPRQVA